MYFLPKVDIVASMTLSKSIDLHIHSTHSDGTLRPAEIVGLAASEGLAAISITDHDTVSGTEEAVRSGREKNIEVIPGIEISSWHGDTSMHILGYGFRHDDTQLAEKLAQLQNGRETRNVKIIENLNRLGIRVEPDELLRYSPYGQTGRPHIARLLVDKGITRSVELAFKHYLGRGAAAYAERFRFLVDDAIGVIKAAGGFAVLAHPGSLDPGLHSILDLLRSLQRSGLEGVEVYYPSHSKKMAKKLMRIAGDLGLLMTGGSDFHDPEQSRFGMNDWFRKTVIPYELFAAMKNR